MKEEMLKKIEQYYIAEEFVDFCVFADNTFTYENADLNIVVSFICGNGNILFKDMKVKEVLSLIKYISYLSIDVNDENIIEYNINENSN